MTTSGDWLQIHVDPRIELLIVLCHSQLPDLQPVIPYSPYLIDRAGGVDRLAAFADALRAFACGAPLGATRQCFIRSVETLTFGRHSSTPGPRPWSPAT